ncbi:hypothetical protein QNM99_18315 [Pseudomonas sp. PCH446]
MFEAQGWFLDLESDEPKMYYKDGECAGGGKLEGQKLKEKLREGCTSANFGEVVECKPVSAMVCAISSSNYAKLQIKDFVLELRTVLGLALGVMVLPLERFF